MLDWSSISEEACIPTPIGHPVLIVLLFSVWFVTTRGTLVFYGQSELRILTISRLDNYIFIRFLVELYNWNLFSIRWYNYFLCCFYSVHFYMVLCCIDDHWYNILPIQSNGIIRQINERSLLFQAIYSQYYTICNVSNNRVPIYSWDANRILIFSANLASIYNNVSAPFNIIRPCNLDRRTICSKSELLITETCAAVTTTPIISLLLTCIFIYRVFVSILSAYKVGMGGPWLLILREQLEVDYWYEADKLKGGILLQSLKV